MLVFNERTGEFEERPEPGKTPSSNPSGYKSSTPSNSNDPLNRDIISDVVYNILSDVLYIDIYEIDEYSFIQDDLGADSIDVQEIIERVEETFGILVLEEDVKEIETVDEMIDYICDELGIDDDEDFEDEDDDDDNEDEEWDDDDDWIDDDEEDEDDLDDDDDDDDWEGELEPDEDWIPDDEEEDDGDWDGELEPDQDWIADDDDEQDSTVTYYDISVDADTDYVKPATRECVGKNYNPNSFKGNNNNLPSYFGRSKRNLASKGWEDQRDMIRDHVFNIIEDKLCVDYDDITEDSSFFSDLGADSLDIVELVMTLENVYDISISDEDAENIVTVGDAIDYIYYNI